MFPDYSIQTIIEDLRQTHSLDLTVENILDGRLFPTLPSFQQEPSLSSPSVLTDVNPIVSSEIIEGQEKLFVNDPLERQLTLQSRKRELIDGARERFLFRQRHKQNNSHIDVVES